MTEPETPRPIDLAAPAPDRALFRRFIPEIDHRTTGAILAHPGYARMRRDYIANTTASYRVSRFPGGLQVAAYRAAAIGAIVCLHAAHDDADRATWATLARLKQAVGQIGLSSPRQIDDLVARLIATGHVVLERPASDGRLRFLRPTERLLSWDREVAAGYYETLKTLYPDPIYDRAIARDPVFHLAQRRAAVRMLDVVARFFAENTDLLPMHGMNHAVHILMKLIDARYGDPEARIRESHFHGMTPLFGASRSQIRNVLVGAEACGLVTRSGDGRRNLDVTTRGLTCVDRFIADTLASHDMTCRMALQSLHGSP